ncbi:MAG: hypothetical protein ACFB13_05425 [Kiloniellaceae bacterium]
MDTTIKPTGLQTVHQPAPEAQASLATADIASTTSEKIETPHAVTAAEGGAKAALKQSAPNAALTTYKDHDSGRLIVRVYDRVSGDILVEFPPEKAFRSVEEVLIGVGKPPKTRISV